jgi:predicted phage terminase large subunit-like protein
MTKLRTDTFEASMLRQSYYRFLQTFWPVVSKEKLRLNWHIEYLCSEIQEISERIFLDKPKTHDLVVNCPPSSSKSTVFSVMWQPWFWTRMPSGQFINGSYTATLSLHHARLSRDIVTSDKYRSLFPEITLREDQSSKGLFMNTRGGFRFSTGVGGTVMGFHGHVLTIDDPIDPLGALSDLVLAEANFWCNETLSSRKVNKEVTVMAMVMQRLHQWDPTGDWLERSPIGIKHLVFPAEDSWDIKPPECKANYVNGLLDPVRLTHISLEKERVKGTAYYAGQFGQSPVARSGNLFLVDLLKYKSDIPSKWKGGPVRYWDNAGSTKKRSAWTVGVKAALDFDDNIWILDVVRGQWDSGTRERIKLDVARKDGRQCRIGQEQEPAASGKESADSTARRMALSGFRITVDRPQGDKEERAQPYSVLVNQGKVILVIAPWNKVYVDEMRYFPASKHKDQIDASSGAVSKLERPRIKVGGLRW